MSNFHFSKIYISFKNIVEIPRKKELNNNLYRISDYSTSPTPENWKNATKNVAGILNKVSHWKFCSEFLIVLLHVPIFKFISGVQWANAHQDGKTSPHDTTSHSCDSIESHEHSIDNNKYSEKSSTTSKWNNLTASTLAITFMRLNFLFSVTAIEHQGIIRHFFELHFFVKLLYIKLYYKKI